ncbi:hypothetical protein QF040_001849 [Variovorax sp. W2I14]
MTTDARRALTDPFNPVNEAMNHLQNIQRRGAMPTLRQCALAAAVASVFAFAAGNAAAQAAPAAGETAMVKLIRGLLQSGTLAKDVGEALLAQAQTEALAAQQAQQRMAASATAASASVAGGVRLEAGDVRVPYISQTVRDQIRDEVKAQVMAQAKDEGWAAPNETPEWSKRIRVEGDVRVRNESRSYASNNSNIEINWAELNKGSGYDVNPNTNLALPSILNTLKSRRNVFRARARLGVFADLSENTKAGVRLASGSDESPVSTTQTLGGGLSKKSVWLDQMWISHKPVDWLTVTAGRFGNPFMSSDVLFSNDLNFDGIAAQFEKKLASNRDLTLFGTLGLIPLEYSSDNAPSRAQAEFKAKSENKWLLGAQVGADWKIDEDNRLRGALAYYNFRNISGKVSEPCALYAGADGCSTDWSRPAFMQKGNTLMLLRDIALDPLNPAGTPQPQYVGLASQFRLIDLNLRWDTQVAGNNLRLDANFVRNTAYDANDIWRRAGVRGTILNNFGPTGGTSQADFKSGGNAYMLQATYGKPAPAARGDWNVLAGYKRIEPDALPDGYNDSTFHGGGTNARGYFLGGSYAIDKNMWFTGRWLSTREVFGPPLSIDTLQLEFNARF